MIRVLIADDHTIVRDGLKQILSEQTDIEVGAEATTGDEVLEALSEDGFDLVLLDMSMPGRSGVELVKAVRAAAPDMGILVLSMHSEDQYAVRAIKAGAGGYLTKASAADQLLDGIRRVADGKLYINGDVAEKLARSLAKSDRRQRHQRLSDREYDVFLRLARGESVTEIATSLDVSSKTISTHKARIMQKLDVANLSEMIRYAMDHQLLDAAPAAD